MKWETADMFTVETSLQFESHLAESSIFYILGCTATATATAGPV